MLAAITVLKKVCGSVRLLSGEGLRLCGVPPKSLHRRGVSGIMEDSGKVTVLYSLMKMLKGE